MWGVVVAHKMASVSLRPLFGFLCFVLGLKGLGLRVWGKGLTI